MVLSLRPLARCAGPLPLIALSLILSAQMFARDQREASPP
jgi:hypothetical protein